jgi:twitching motility protein PilT
MSITRDQLMSILKEASEDGASEVHFKVPNRPMLRAASGALVQMSRAALTPRDTQAAVFALCSLAKLEIPVAQLQDQEFSFGIHGVGRFRAYVYRQRGSLSAVIQRFATDVPTASSLRIDPDDIKTVGRPGLLLIAGSRRDALLAACIGDFNARSRGQVWVIEAPLSYLHRDGMASISQREIGVDVPDFATGIRQGCRVGADVLAVREVEQANTAHELLTACEKGISCIASVAASSVEDAQWWITRMFSGQQRTDAEKRLKDVLQTIIVLGDRDPVAWHADTSRFHP